MLLFRSCCPTKPKAVRKRKLWIFWDIDGTLFNIPQNVREFATFSTYKHMTIIPPTYARSYVFMIYLEKTQAIFRYLLDMRKQHEQDLDIEIAFMTAGGYDASVLPFLERTLELPRGSLKKSIIVNRFIYDSVFFKGEKLQLLRSDGIIAPDDQVILIDNLQEHIDDAIRYGFTALLAEGYCEELGKAGDVITYNPSSKYLDALRVLVADCILQQQAAIEDTQTKKIKKTKEEPAAPQIDKQEQKYAIAVTPSPA